MFIDSKYTKCYYNIIEQARNRSIDCYVEEHHVIPRSFNGTNEPNNLVLLTAREHFICHLLLAKMTTGKDGLKMLSAYFLMSRLNRKDYFKINSHLYELLRKKYAEKISGKTILFMVKHTPMK